MVGGRLGGAVDLGSWDAATFEATSSSFTGNGAVTGGAIALNGWGAPVVLLDACTLDGNTATTEGGAFALYAAGSVRVVDSAVTASTAGICGGAVVDISNGASLTSVASDWGSGAADNAPDDVCGYRGFGAASSFTCRYGTCY